MIDEEGVREALGRVNDPHIPTGIDRLGMVRGVDVTPDGSVVVQLGIPCLGCPGVSMLKVAGRLMTAFEEDSRLCQRTPSLRAQRSNPSHRGRKDGLLRRFAPRNDGREQR